MALQHLLPGSVAGMTSAALALWSGWPLWAALGAYSAVGTLLIVAFAWIYASE